MSTQLRINSSVHTWLDGLDTVMSGVYASVRTGKTEQDKTSNRTWLNGGVGRGSRSRCCDIWGLRVSASEKYNRDNIRALGSMVSLADDSGILFLAQSVPYQPSWHLQKPSQHSPRPEH